MVITIDIRSSEQIERMRAVVADNRLNRESAENAVRQVSAVVLPRSLKDASHHQLVALIKIGNRALGAQAADLVSRRVVAVEIRRCIYPFAVGVIRHHGEVMTEAFLDFQNTAVVIRRTQRGVAAILQNRWHRKPSRNTCSRATRTNPPIPHSPLPILDTNNF